MTTDDGCRLWTAVTGTGPPVVLVHGGPGWWYRRRVAEILAREPSDAPWIARISTGFANRTTALTQAHRLNTPRFEPNHPCAEALRAIPNRAALYHQIAVPTLLKGRDLGSASCRP